MQKFNGYSIPGKNSYGKKLLQKQYTPVIFYEKYRPSILEFPRGIKAIADDLSTTSTIMAIPPPIKLIIK